MRIRLLVLAPVMAIAALGCGSDDEKTPAEQWFADYTNTLCSGYGKCCTEAGEPNDPAACQQFMGLLGGMQMSSALSKGSSFDQAAADQCIADLKAWFATCPPSGSGPASCDRVITGPNAPGQPCTSSFDCAPSDTGSADCWFDASSGQSSETGTCRVTMPPAENQPCTSSASSDGNVYYECASDPAYYCDYQSSLCKKLPTIGQACADVGACSPDAYCRYSSDTSTSICTARLAVGDACDASANACVESAYCDASTLRCAAKKAAGETCSSFTECKGWCNDSQVCEGSSGAMMCFTSSNE